MRSSCEPPAGGSRRRSSRASSYRKGCRGPPLPLWLEPRELESTGRRFRRALAQGYDAQGRPISYPTNVGTAAGLVSTVLDLVAYAAAIEAGRLYPPGGRELAFSPARTPSGAELPYGLGWFVEEGPGGRILWHFGSWIGNSALIVLVPSRGASFALLANSDRLSTPFPLQRGDLESSPFARAFLGWLESGDGCVP
ncbi:MAG: serine hydrolase domain-containing protein [Gemmatimonadota bacterium]